jgi:tripartite-type tricarboxylate transporter receptor subunit TctC
MTTTMRRRRFIRALGAAAVWPLAAPALATEPWPTRPVTVLCPFAAGTSADTLMRLINDSLDKKFGQNFIVEDRPGATGNIAAGAAARAAPDGYTLLIATVGPIVNNKFLYKNLDFDPDRAFTPIALLAYSPLIIVGSPKLPVTNLKELVAYAKAKRGPLNAGTVGVGSQAHITIQLLNKLAGISIGHVSYRISSQALPDLASGDLQLSVQYIPTFVPQVQSGMLRGLAVTSRTRLPELPDVPTVDESGFPGLEASAWFALFAPTGTPRDIIDKECGRKRIFAKRYRPRAARQNLDDADGWHAGTARRLHQERECQVGADHQASEHHVAVAESEVWSGVRSD